MSRTFIAALLLTLASAAAAADIEQTIKLAASEFELVNLIGEVTVKPATGKEFEAVIHIRGRDAKPGLVDVVKEEGSQGRIYIKFPVEEQRDYVYPPLGHGRATVILDDEGHGGWLHKVLKGLTGQRIDVRGKGKGLEVWADIEVRVPRDATARIEVKVGAIASAGVKGDLVLDTGSGEITVTGHEGPLVCDTGSGAVDAGNVVGDLLVDTGSGSVDVGNHVGSSLKIDTGSGSVEITGTETEYLFVDTGSGSVTAEKVKTDSARIDTGSGSVTLALERVGKGKFVIDTGSGGVNLVLPRNVSAEIGVDVGSGGIDHDLTSNEIVHEERDQLEAKLGGGAARFIIDTGSGGVDIKRR